MTGVQTCALPILNGYIKIPEDAIYTFYMSNIDEAAKLYINDVESIDAHLTHGKHEHRHKLGLQAGYHKIKIEYVDTTGDEKLTLQIKAHSLGHHHAVHHEKHAIGRDWLFRK